MINFNPTQKDFEQFYTYQSLLLLSLYLHVALSAPSVIKLPVSSLQNQNNDVILLNFLHLSFVFSL